MSSASADRLELLPGLAIVTEDSPGTMPFSVVLIGTPCGHRPDHERSLLDVLRAVHDQQPLGWLFTLCDPRHLYLSVVGENEADVTAYRSFPDKAITKGIVEYMVKDGHSTGAIGFTIVAEPGVPLQGYDDPYGRALARDSLLQLDVRSASNRIALRLINDAFVSAGQGRSPATGLDHLERLLTCSLSLEEWEAGRGQADAALGREPSAVLPALRVARLLADSFYEGMRLRVDALVDKAVQRLTAKGTTRAAILVDVHWLRHAATRLRDHAVPYLQVVLADGEPGSFIDLTGSFFETEPTTPLGDLFSGKRDRTLVERLADRPADITGLRAEEWTVAAQAYLDLFERFGRAADRESGLQCLQRALEIAPHHPRARWLKALALNIQGNREAALREVEDLVRREPRSAEFRLAWANLLAQAGRAHDERAVLTRALWVTPWNGTLWNALGIHFHGQGRRRAARYCFAQGERHKSAEAATNLRQVRCVPVRWWHCPLAVAPPVLKAMSNVLLPLYHDWEDARLKGFLLTGVAGALLLAGYGGWAGWRANRAGGAATGAVAALVCGALFWAAVGLCGLAIVRWQGRTAARLGVAATLLLLAGAGRQLATGLLTGVPAAWDRPVALAAWLLGPVVPASGLLAIQAVRARRWRAG